jgi:hypothetical protein
MNFTKKDYSDLIILIVHQNGSLSVMNDSPTNMPAVFVSVLNPTTFSLFSI